MIIRPSFTVLSGAAIGLVAGAAVYGAVSSSATPTLKPTKAVVAAAPAAVASCAKGQKLEDGVCVIHIVRTVVVPAPAAAQLPTTSRVPEATTNQGAGSSARGADATKAAHDAEEVGHGADDATEAAEGAAEGSASDVSADRAANDDSNVATH
jgi:hypothetical protein